MSSKVAILVRLPPPGASRIDTGGLGSGDSFCHTSHGDAEMPTTPRQKDVTTGWTWDWWKRARFMKSAYRTNGRPASCCQQHRELLGGVLKTPRLMRGSFWPSGKRGCGHYIRSILGLAETGRRSRERVRGGVGQPRGGARDGQHYCRSCLEAEQGFAGHAIALERRSRHDTGWTDFPKGSDYG